MKEIEVKILEVNRHKAEETLCRLGAKKVFDSEIETCFFDFIDGTIANARNVLRLRREGGTIVLTLKRVRETQTAKVAESIRLKFQMRTT
jgi:adenylate cyclase class IV